MMMKPSPIFIYAFYIWVYLFGKLVSVLHWPMHLVTQKVIGIDNNRIGLQFFIFYVLNELVHFLEEITWWLFPPGYQVTISTLFGMHPSNKQIMSLMGCLITWWFYHQVISSRKCTSSLST